MPALQPQHGAHQQHGRKAHGAPVAQVAARRCGRPGRSTGPRPPWRPGGPDRTGVGQAAQKTVVDVRFSTVWALAPVLIALAAMKEERLCGGVRGRCAWGSTEKGGERDQTMGWCTVTSLVPSGKVASTWMSGNHLGDAIHHVGAGQHGAAFAHQLGHGLAVARALPSRRR